jgi:hypothetical protein
MANANIAVTYKEDKSLIDKCGHGYKFVTGVCTFDGGNYVTNGTAMDLSKVFPTEIHLILFEARAGYVFEYDYANKKVKAYFYDYDGSADGVAIEYTNGAAISAAPRFLAIGR